VTEDALVFAARQLNLRISPEQQARLMKAHLEMSVWPDVAPVLDWLKKSGYRLALLSNFTQEMLAANLRHSGIAYAFEQVLSTDQAKTYKPDPRAYQLGMDKLELKAEDPVRSVRRVGRRRRQAIRLPNVLGKSSSLTG
jgi:2-haloacid dehalogenase